MGMSRRYSRRGGMANSDENSELLLLYEMEDAVIDAYGTIHDDDVVDDVLAFVVVSAVLELEFFVDFELEFRSENILEILFLLLFFSLKAILNISTKSSRSNFLNLLIL